MSASKTLPKYEPPRVVTYREDEILKQMGPVGGCATGAYDPYAAPMNPFRYNMQYRRPGIRSRRYRSSLRSIYSEDYIEDDTDF